MTHSDQAELAARQCDAEISPLAATPVGTAADCDKKSPTLRDDQARNQAIFDTARKGILVVDDQQKRAEEELTEYAYALESANKALEEFYQEADSANRAKSRFLENMSHELRTPLHAILSFATFGIKKAETASPEDLLRYFEKIEHSGKILLTLVNDLLYLARLESGETRFEFGPTDLGLLIHTVVEEFNSIVASREIKIQYALPEFDASVVAVRARLMQVIRNLLNNAVESSPHGSTIEIEVTRNEPSIAVAVRDRGVGIPEDEQEAVFGKFVQSSKTRTGAGGTGLGLSICKQIIAIHHGRVWAESRPAGGTVLTFEIPLNPDVAEEAAPGAENG